MEIEIIDLNGPQPLDRPAEEGAGRARRLPPRVRTTVLVTIAVAVTLLVVSGIAISARRSQLEHALDRDLTRRALALESAIADGPLSPILVVDGDDRFTQVLQSPGVVVANSPDLDGRGPLSVIVPRPGATSFTTTEATVAGQLEEVRVVARALTAPAGVASSTVVAAGAPLRTIDDDVATLQTVLLASAALLVVGAGSATWVRTGR